MVAPLSFVDTTKSSAAKEIEILAVEGLSPVRLNDVE
jgi:hypothetical protein